MEQGNRRYDILTVEAMRRVVRPDSNCIDIGAATGEMLKYIVALAPDGTHQAFEPVPSQASALRKRFPVVQVHELALSDKTAEVDFFVVKDDGNISALHNPQEIRGLVGDTCISDWQGQVETITVEACTLDDVLGADVGSLDFIKMDVEGAEVAVFRGALRTLAKCGPIVVFECSGENVEELYGATNLFDVLSEVDFSVSTLDGWLAGEGPLWPSEYPSKDTVSGEWNWMYVAHPTH
jgi:FkbM family methyltransferase